MSPNSFPLYTGETIDDGRLRLRSVLGQGGFGVVYAATDRAGAPFAVKWLGLPHSFDARSDDECDAYLSHLRDEAAAHARVSGHPHVVRLHRTVADHKRTCYWMVLAQAPGGDVFDLVQLRNAFWNDEARTKALVLQLCDAVVHVHARGVAHRDIKPENILLDRAAQTAYLSDFGAATTATRASNNLGTAEYMAPGMHLRMHTRPRRS